MGTLEESLNQLAEQVQLTASALDGNRFTAKLALSSNSILPPLATARIVHGDLPSNPLDISGTLEVRQIVQEPVNLQWISEAVRFAPESDPPAPDDLSIPPDIIGQLPVQPSLPLAGATIPPGVGGAIGLLTGTIPVFEILEELVTTTATIEVRWRVLDENKVPLTAFGWSSGSLTGSGSEFVPPTDQILNQAVNLLLVPPFVDLVSLSPPPPVRRWIQAHFRLSAAGISTPWIDLEVPVDLVPLAIPTVLLLFFDPDFGGPALLVLPENSQLGPDLLLSTLTDVRDVLTAVRDLVGFVGLFIDVVNALEPVFNTLEIAATKADAIPNLNDLDVVGTSWWKVWKNDREAEDEFASLMFLGAPGRSVQAFNARGFDDSQGQLNINLGPEMAVTIRTLYHGASGDFLPPDAVPANRVTVATAPQGCRGFWCWAGGGRDITTFGDEFSSLRFGW